MASSQNIHIPPGPPRESGPLYSDFFEQQVAKQRNNNYHSTSLANMVATSVNRTALHPGGVQYVFLLPSITVWTWQLTVPGRVTVTLNSRRNSTSTHTLTTTVSLLYVFALSRVLCLCTNRYRSQTPLFLPSTKMLSSTKPALPSPPAVLSLPTPVPKLAVLPQISGSSRRNRQKTMSGGDP